MKSKFVQELKAHGIKNIFDLTECDQWANDATREDVNNIMAEQDVFGLDVGNYELLERHQLKNICNFGVTYIFKIMDWTKIVKLVTDYKTKEEKEFNMHDAMTFYSILGRISIYCCTWV